MEINEKAVKVAEIDFIYFDTWNKEVYWFIKKHTICIRYHVFFFFF